MKLLVPLMVCLLFVLIAHAAAPPTATPQMIDDAIKKGVDYLYSKQNKGTWEKNDKRDPTTKNWSVDGGQWGSFIWQP